MPNYWPALSLIGWLISDKQKIKMSSYEIHYRKRKLGINIVDLFFPIFTQPDKAAAGRLTYESLFRMKFK